MYPASRLILAAAFVAATSSNIAFGETDDETNRRIQRYALLIAADDYAPPIAKLEYCRNDMQDLQTRLEAAGFAADSIIAMNDGAEDSRLRPTKANILHELNLLLQLANENDVVLVAFSGHGLHFHGESYLCPSDANLDGTSSLVSVDDIYGLMEKCVAGQKLLILDACRNEPFIRGFKASQMPQDVSIQLREPPHGLIVLSSCEPKQLSAEDPKLHHGVFMHYIIQGLEGAADTNEDIGGNNNGRITLDELYYYAHEKTKLHVARSHGIVQRPVMRGEIVGRFELATVPDASTLRSIVRRGPTTSKKKAPPADTAVVSTSTTTTKAADSPLLRQANDYFSAGKYDNAIDAFTAIIDDGSLDPAFHKEARKGRGAAYLARAEKGDIDKALIDQLAAGLPGIQLTVLTSTAELRVENDVKGKLKKNQSVVVSKIVGEWLWVSSVDGSNNLQGYIKRSAVLAPEVASTPVTTNTRPVMNEDQSQFYPPHHPPQHPYPGHPHPPNDHHRGNQGPLGNIGGQILRQALQGRHH